MGKRLLLFDAYNANPDSMQTLFNNLKSVPKEEQKSLVILGEMLELGDLTESAHKDLGQLVGSWVAQNPKSEIWFVGKSAGAFSEGLRESSFSGNFYYSESVTEGDSQRYKDRLNDFDLVVFKGSRGARLERVLQHWGLQDLLGEKE